MYIQTLISHDVGQRDTDVSNVKTIDAVHFCMKYYGLMSFLWSNHHYYFFIRRYQNNKNMIIVRANKSGR